MRRKKRTIVHGGERGGTESSGDGIFKAYFADAYDPILVFPVRGGKAGKYVDVNAMASVQFGYTRREFLRMRPYDLDSRQNETPFEATLPCCGGNSQYQRKRVMIDGDGGEQDVVVRNTLVVRGSTKLVFQQVLSLFSLRRVLGEDIGRVLEAERNLKAEDVLRGTLHVCAYCRRVETRDDRWVRFETFLMDNTLMGCNHGICPVCEEVEKKKMERQKLIHGR
jgi:PAS domain-containing protein